MCRFFIGKYIDTGCLENFARELDHTVRSAMSRDIPNPEKFLSPPIAKIFSEQPVYSEVDQLLINIDKGGWGVVHFGRSRAGICSACYVHIFLR